MAVTVSKMEVSNNISSLGGPANTIKIVNGIVARKLSDSGISRSLFNASQLATMKVPLMLSVTRASLYANTGDFKIIKNASSSDSSREQYRIGSNPIRLQLVVFIFSLL